MPSVITHALVGFAFGKALSPRGAGLRLPLVAAACSVLPDADVVAFPLGIPYGEPLGHRGFSHSLCFAVLLGAGAAWLARNRVAGGPRPLWLFLSLVTAAHGLLDAICEGGLGIAFFSPFDTTRYFFPFRPVRASPIGFFEFFGRWGYEVIVDELLWIWLPTGLLCGVIAVTRRGALPFQPPPR